MTHTTITSILDLVVHAKIVKGVKSGTFYLINNWSGKLCAEFSTSETFAHNGEWVLSTGEKSLSYFEGNPDFEVIAESK